MQKYFSPVLAIIGIITGILTYHSTIAGTLPVLIGIGLLIVVPTIITSAQHMHFTLVAYLFSLIGYGAAWYETSPHELFCTHYATPQIITGTVVDYMHCAHMNYPHRITIALEGAFADQVMYVYTNKISSPDDILNNFLITRPLTLKKPTSSFGYYLIKEGIIGTAFVPHIKLTYHKTPTITWNAWLHATRAAIFTRIQQALSPEHFALYSTLFLGNKSYDKAETDPIHTHFRTWGISHIFARSGIHIAIIINLLLYALTFLPVPYTFKISFAACICTIYACCSWSTISFARALCMFLLASYCIVLRRQVSGLYLLALTTLWVLLWHPLNLFFLDFQLSFALTGALIWVSGQCNRTRQKA